MKLRRSFTLVSVAAAALAVLCSCASQPGSSLETDHAGRTLAQWMKSYWQWTISGTGTGHDGDVAFLPVPMGSDPMMTGTLTGSLDTTLAASDTFALPLFVWIGETYAGSMTPDDDRTMPPRTTFTTMSVRLTIDGETVLDSTRDDLGAYYFDAIDFDQTLPYAMPTSYGATGAIWVKGLGILHAPLSRGTHTIHLVERNDTAMVGYDNTWHITVN